MPYQLKQTVFSNQNCLLLCVFFAGTKESIEISLLESSSTSILPISVSVAQENSRSVGLFRLHSYFISLILFLHVLLAVRGVKPSKC
jgi:hypothetical protein